MRKSNREIFDKSLITPILKDAKIVRLAMMDEDVPYIVPFNYGYQEGCIYIHSAPQGKKIDLLKKNNKVCFELEQMAEIKKAPLACNWTTSYRSIIGYGFVDILSDPEEKKKGLEIIMTHHGAPEEMKFEDNQVEPIVILKLTITRLTAKKSGDLEKLQATKQNVQ